MGEHQMEAMFVAAIRAAPDDQAVKLAYADWLQQRGDPRANVIRSQESHRNCFGDRAAANRFLAAVGEYIAALKPGARRARVWQPSELLEDLSARLDDRGVRTFETDCAERVLPIFEAAHPNDDRPRAAVRACRLYLAGQTNLEVLQGAVRRAQDAMKEVDEPAWNAAAAACNAADYGNAYGGLPSSWHAVDAVAGIASGEQAR
jgi:uncharacterized protein (TIGR02996 family)